MTESRFTRNLWQRLKLRFHNTDKPLTTRVEAVKGVSVELRRDPPEVWVTNGQKIVPRLFTWYRQFFYLYKMQTGLKYTSGYGKIKIFVH